MTSTPTLTGQDIKLAERATRGVLDVLLAETAASFMQMTVVNTTAIEGPVVTVDRIVERLAFRLKVSESEIRETIGELLALGLLARTGDGDEAVEVTADGQERFERLRADTARITERLHNDLPAEDLATARRVLSMLTARANAEISGGAATSRRDEA